MRNPLHIRSFVLSTIAITLLSACAATTTVITTPPGQAPVCQPDTDLRVAVRWGTNWRLDQKDVVNREAAASKGITDFFASAKCFRSSSVSRSGASNGKSRVPEGSDLLLLLTVRELGPVVKLLSSAALVEGGTEAVVDVALFRPRQDLPIRQFTIQWRDGGPGVLKGVRTLPQDMASALAAGLLPN